MTASHDDIVKILIARSIASYSGSCPCPYSVNSAGNTCGGTSAYSRSGGASVLCYSSDVTEEMIRQYQIGV